MIRGRWDSEKAFFRAYETEAMFWFGGWRDKVLEHVQAFSDARDDGEDDDELEDE